jgi:hypothetical protein
MSASLAALHAPIGVGLGGVLLANMLAGWLDGDPKVLPTGARGLRWLVDQNSKGRQERNLPRRA